MAFDQSRLDELRRRFAGAGGGAMHDPHFSAVAASVFKDDVVEIAPQYDPTTNTAQIAAQVLFELLCLVALKPCNIVARSRSAPLPFRTTGLLQSGSLGGENA